MAGPLFAPERMHAPDGFFAIWLSIIGWLMMVAIVAVASRATRNQLGERQIPLMGLVAAAIFAGQMLNFQIPGGTSGHLLGGALAAVILGPWGAVLVMTAVIAIQALLFQDGGLLALGLNVINMGIVTSFVGYFAYRMTTRVIKGRPGILAGAAAGAWLSVVVTSAFTAVELAISGTSPLRFVLPMMVGVHVLIGIGEALLTVFALSFILTTRADVITGDQAPGQRSAAWIMVGFLLVLSLTLLAPFASPYADGLERVAQILSAPQQANGSLDGGTPQFFGSAKAPSFQFLPNYTIPGLGNSGISTILAGMIGVSVVFAAASVIAWLVRRSRQEDRHHLALDSVDKTP